MNAHLHGRRGFTLIEMIITLCVFLLLAGAVFQIFSATLDGAGSLQDNQFGEDRTEALGGWLRNQFTTLPATGVIASYHRDGSPLRTNCLIWGTSGSFQALDLHAQPDGRYLLRLASWTPAGEDEAQPASQQADDFSKKILADDPALTWRPMLRDLVSASWRFQNALALVWTDTAAGREALVEFNFKVAGSSAAVTEDCWVPPLQPIGLPAPAVTANP